MSAFVIRGFHHPDEAGLLEVWNRALPCDPVSAPVFRRKVLLDPNFDPDWLSVAQADGRVVGFCLCLVRRTPMDKVGPEPERAWITAFAVDPGCRHQGIGKALLARALDFCRGAGRRDVLVAPYTPNYFVPGVDVERYAEGLAFLQRHGFQVLNEAISMDADLVRLDTAHCLEREAALAAQGIAVRALQADQSTLLLEFLKAHMPGDWVRHARDVLTDATRGLATPDQFTVALRAGEVLGYCQFEGEHFGPFGVREDCQGQGIGTVLLARCLETMRRHGHHGAWVLWTSDDTARKVYGKFGFQVTRRFALLRLRLP